MRKRRINFETVIERLRAGGHPNAVAKELGTSKAYIYKIAKTTNTPLTFERRSKSRLFHEAIRAGYAAGKSPSLIAEELKTSVSSVKVIASRLGVTDKNFYHDPFQHRRGYAIPVELREKYKELRKLKLTIKECGYELGLLERKE